MDSSNQFNQSIDSEILEKYISEREAANTKYNPRNIWKQRIKSMDSGKKLQIVMAVGVIAYFGFSMSAIRIESFFQSIDDVVAVGRSVILFGMLVVLIVWRGLVRQRNQLSDDSIVYTKLIQQEVVKKFGSDSKFDNKQGLPEDEVHAMNCFKKTYSRIYGKKQICGIYKGKIFSSGFEDIERIYTEIEEDGREVQRYETIFKGVIVCVDYPRFSQAPLGLRSKTRVEMQEDMQKKDTSAQITGTENEYFNRIFKITSESEQNLFYILTPDFMEKLTALYRNADDIYLYFTGSKLYFGIDSQSNFMNFSAVEPTPEGLEGLRKQIVLQLEKVEQQLDIAFSL